MCRHVCRLPGFHLGSCLPGSGPWSVGRGFLTVSTAGHAVCRPTVKAGAGPRPADCGHCFTDRPSGGQDGTELGAGPALGPSYWGKTPPPVLLLLLEAPPGYKNATPGAAAREVIITSIDKRAALLEHGVLPAGLLLAKGQRLPNKSKRKKRRQGTRENRRKKGRAV